MQVQIIDGAGVSALPAVPALTLYSSSDLSFLLQILLVLAVRNISTSRILYVIIDVSPWCVEL